MKTSHDILREGILRRCGLGDPNPPGSLDLERLRKSEWSAEFERLMRDGLVMGAFRYGKLGDPHKPQYNRLEDIIYRARRYRETGNDELLRDIANLCLIEFVEGTHPNKHFSAADDGDHTSSV